MTTARRICSKCHERSSGQGGYCTPCNTERARVYREQQVEKTASLPKLEDWMRAIVRPQEQQR